MIPHPPVVWEQVRAVDVVFLLLLGCLSQAILRGVVLSVKLKPASLRKKEDAFFKLEYDTIQLRNKGPSAFVETSKSERQLLALDKDLQQMYQNRSEKRAQMEKLCMRYIRTVLYASVFFLYYGVAVIQFSGVEQGRSIDIPMFFPLSVAEVGFRLVSKWGFPKVEEGAVSGLGALVVMWAGSTFVDQIMDGVDNLLLL